MDKQETKTNASRYFVVDMKIENAVQRQHHEPGNRTPKAKDRVGAI
jgi:hypothetical protein